MLSRVPWLAIVFTVMLPALLIRGEEPADKPLPRVALTAPLALPVGAKTKVLVRGWNLQEVSEVRSEPALGPVLLAGKDKAAIPGRQDAKQIGDTQVEVEVELPADALPGELTLILISPHGEVRQPIYVGSEIPAVLEQEPNDGFRSAQPIVCPQVIDGQIHGDRNVDVFRLELAEPRRMVLEVIAQQRGSALDSVLTLFDQEGRIVSVHDDGPQRGDSRIERELPAGRYYISLQDALDRGGPAHPYRLQVR